jgi:5'-methylthioadenosine phosphorylase
MGVLGASDNEFDKIGFIIGSNKIGFDGLVSFQEQKLDTDFGTAMILVDATQRIYVLERHGPGRNIPPHMVNYRANILAFKDLKIDKILSFTSVGTLKTELPPGSMLMPDDYINMRNILTYHDQEIRHIIPGLDNDLRKQIYDEIKQLPISVQFNGTYIQTPGPRLETKAEIQMLKNFGDVVGMTMANEATLAKELGLGYANISIVDNFCNGITGKTLSMDELKQNQLKNSENLRLIIQKLIT